LNKLRSHYHIPESLYRDIKIALSYDANKVDCYLDEIYTNIPVSLKMELMMCVHDDALSKFTFLKSLGGRNFITWVTS